MKKIIQTIKENYKLIAIALILGVLLGSIFFNSGHDEAVSEQQAEEIVGHNHEDEEATIWTCSMHPQVREEEPGLCPICAMELIPLASLEATDNTNPNELSMTEAAIKLAEIQTSVVSRGIPQRTTYLQGKVQADERNIARITSRFGGRIEDLNINFTGQQVQKGEKLATIYSPELVTAQRELLEAAAIKESRPALYNAAKRKLQLWNLTDVQIAEIESSGEPQMYFDVLSPISGTVMMRHVSLGDYVQEGTALFQVTDLSKVWVMFDAYEDDLPWLNVGDAVEFTVQSLPGKEYNSKITYIDPYIDSKTRIAKVRIEVSNNKGELKPEMFADAVVRSEIDYNSEPVLVPKSSVLWTGKQSVVYVKVPGRESPTFLSRQITLGPLAGDQYVVTDGLQEGEEIATNGVFKIDAAAQLAGKVSMMNPDGGDSGVMNMPGMDMGSQSNNDQQQSMSMPDESEIPDQFKQQLTKVYHDYISMKDAFVTSEAANVSQAAGTLEQALKEVNMELLKGNNHMKWMDLLAKLNSSVQSISQQSDIEEQRKNFSEFNNAFYETIKQFGLINTTVYYQFCPMFNNTQGAYWLSNTEEILNPYYGDAMLSCGETKETL